MPIIDDPGDVILRADSQGDGIGRVVIQAGAQQHILNPDGTGTGVFGGSQTAIDNLSRWREKLVTSPTEAVIEVWGDSTAEEANYAVQFTQLRTYHTQNGMPLAGMTADSTHIASKGNSGVALTDYLAGGTGTSGHQLADFRASTADLIILRWLTNDTRLGSRTKSQMEADLRTLIGLAPPGADILITVPPTFTTTVVGTDYLSGASVATAQSRWDAARQAIYAVAGDYAHVAVVDPSLDVYGTRVSATSPLMTDQLHPNAAGQAKWADHIATIIGISPRDRLAAILPKARRWEAFGRVTAAGSGYIDIDTLDDRLPSGKEWPLTVSDYLYIPGFTTVPLQLTSATFPASGNNVRILKGGTDFSSVAVGTMVALTGDHAPQGVQAGRTEVTVDPASVSAGTVVETSVTVTGATTNCAVIVQPPTTIDASLIWCAYVSAADTVKLRIYNPTAGAIDPASGTWRFWLSR